MSARTFLNTFIVTLRVIFIATLRVTGAAKTRWLMVFRSLRHSIAAALNKNAELLAAKAMGQVLVSDEAGSPPIAGPRPGRISDAGDGSQKLKKLQPNSSTLSNI